MENEFYTLKNFLIEIEIIVEIIENNSRVLFAVSFNNISEIAVFGRQYYSYHILSQKKIKISVGEWAIQSKFLLKLLNVCFKEKPYAVKKKRELLK